MQTRRPFVAGNWKMNSDRASAVALARAFAGSVWRHENVDVAICPPAPFLLAVHEELAASRIALGAQNMYFEKSGAFTGEISPLMLKDCGCKYVILGHSERRHVFAEDDDLVNRKVISALSNGLYPILCLGETLAQREKGETQEIVAGQLRHGLVGVRPEQMRDVTIAYEPVWAIGTGHVATPEQAEEVHRFLRGKLTEMYGSDLAQSIRIQYGGSVKAENAAGLMEQPNVDGALVGGASLKEQEFLEIVRAAAATI